MTRSHDTPKTMTATTILIAINSAKGQIHFGSSNNKLSNASTAGKYRLTILFGFRSMLNLPIGIDGSVP
jgi:hypothetical protein